MGDEKIVQRSKLASCSRQALLFFVAGNLLQRRVHRGGTDSKRQGEGRGERGERELNILLSNQALHCHHQNDFPACCCQSSLINVGFAEVVPTVGGGMEERRDVADI